MSSWCAQLVYTPNGRPDDSTRGQKVGMQAECVKGITDQNGNLRKHEGVLTVRKRSGCRE
jgi:hypothetical protein